MSLGSEPECNGDSSEVRSRLDFERRRQLKSSTATVDERDSKGKNKEGEDANGNKDINRYLGDCSVKYVDGYEGSRSREFKNQEVDATRGSIIRMEVKFVLRSINKLKREERKAIYVHIYMLI